MTRLYNYDSLLLQFRESLIAVNMKSITVRGYASDVSHFFGWYVSYFSKHEYLNYIPTYVNDGFILNPYYSNYVVIFKSYFAYISKTASESTKRRRLYSLKKFILFCGAKGLLYKEFVRPIESMITQFLLNGCSKQNPKKEISKSSREYVFVS